MASNYAVTFDIKKARNIVANPEREVRWHKHHANRCWRRSVKAALAQVTSDTDVLDDDRFNLDPRRAFMATGWEIA
jgi:hypothetical protein